MLPTPAQMGLMVKGRHSRLPVGLVRPETVWTLFWIVWVENHEPYDPTDLDCISTADCLRLRSADGVREHSWLAFNLEVVLGLQIMLQPGFVDHHPPNQSSLERVPETPTEHYSRVHAHRCQEPETRVNSRKSSLALSDKIWQAVHGHRPHA